MTYPASGERIAVLGFGITGRAVCEYACRHHLSVSVSESSALSPLAEAWLRDHGIPFEQGGHTRGFLQSADLLVISPSVRPALPVVVEARRRGASVISEIEFALRQAPECIVVAVTGTNGKSTTVTVIGEILTFLGQPAWVAGNIGVPVTSILDKMTPNDTVVIEISSYQLEQSPDFHPHVGVLLNLEPDHLHRHGSVDAYALAKSRLFASQGPDDVAILPRALAETFDQGRGRRVYYDEAFPVLPPGADELMLHERANLRAALGACRAVLPDLDTSRVPMDRVRAALRLPHRMETLGFVNGVRVVNDSKSTNAASAIAALRAVDAPVVLLLGGRSKGAGYEALADELRHSTVRSLILFGEAAQMLEGVFVESAFMQSRIVRTPCLHEAIDRGLDVAEPGDVLLFSPACSSFDAFADYSARGEAFSEHIRTHHRFREGDART